MTNRQKTTIVLLVALIFLSSCSLPGLSSDAENDIMIAGGNTTERKILSEIVKQMVQHYMPKTKVGIINNLGSSSLIVQALAKGEANMSGCMYTGTSLTGELQLPAITDPKEAFRQVVAGYRDQLDQTWFPFYGFANTYAFMITRSLSESENITTISDLKTLAPTLKAGVDNSWISRQGDGYEDFKRVYQYDFQSVSPMQIGLVYNAVANREMDVVLGYSTDGRIATYDLVVLKDDLALFPPYDASPVATNAILKKHPELETVLLKLKGTITDSTMRKMNRRSDEELVEPMVIAKEFLIDHNYFESVTPKRSDDSHAE